MDSNDFCKCRSVWIMLQKGFNERWTLYWQQLQFVFGYLDYIVIFSRFVKDHLDHIRTVLGSLFRTCMLPKLEKYYLFKGWVKILGQMKQTASLTISTEATEAICRSQHPIIVTERKSFIGRCNRFLFFVPIFACIAAHLAPSSKMIRLFVLSWWTGLKSKPWRRCRNASCQHRYWPQGDQTNTTSQTMTRVLTKLGASYYRTRLKDQWNQ